MELLNFPVGHEVCSGVDGVNFVRYVWQNTEVIRGEQFNAGNDLLNPEDALEIADTNLAKMARIGTENGVEASLLFVAAISLLRLGYSRRHNFPVIEVVSNTIVVPEEPAVPATLTIAGQPKPRILRTVEGVTMELSHLRTAKVPQSRQDARESMQTRWVILPGSDLSRAQYDHPGVLSSRGGSTETTAFALLGGNEHFVHYPSEPDQYPDS